MISPRNIQWLLRIGWVVLPFAAGPSFADSLHDMDSPIRTTASVGLWVAWALVVAALVIPGTISLVVLRSITSLAPIASALAVADQSSGVLGLGLAIAICVLAFTPHIGELAINAGSYGDEKRYMLRPPGALYLGPLFFAWVLLVASSITGPLLLADQQWVAGAIALLVGAVLVAFLARALHALTQRWIVFVPAGFVLKDHNAVADPVLFRRSEIELLHPAPRGTDAINLTSNALGLALELRLREKVPMVRVMPGRQPAQPGKVARLIFTPTRPGAVIDTAQQRRICVDPSAISSEPHTEPVESD